MQAGMHKHAYDCTFDAKYSISLLLLIDVVTKVYTIIKTMGSQKPQ